MSAIGASPKDCVKNLTDIMFSTFRMTEQALVGELKKMFELWKGIEIVDFKRTPIVDEAKFIDWKLTSRLGINPTRVEFVLRVVSSEMTHTLKIMLDTSSSMMSPKKFELALRSVFALMYIAARVGDNVEVDIFSGKYRVPVTVYEKGSKSPEAAGFSFIYTLCKVFKNLGGEISLNDIVRHLEEKRITRNVILALVTDYWHTKREFDELISHVLWKRIPMIVITVLTEEESYVPEVIPSTLADPEESLDLSVYSKREIRDFIDSVTKHISFVDEKLRESRHIYHIRVVDRLNLRNIYSMVEAYAHVKGLAA